MNYKFFDWYLISLRFWHIFNVSLMAALGALMLDEDWDRSGEMIALTPLNVPGHTEALALALTCFD
jgi:hypothetical protein